MKVLIVTPAPRRSRYGNRVTALRWARILRRLGHHVGIAQEYTGQSCDVLVALHARRSASSVERFRAQRGAVPLILALTGTDVYTDIRTSDAARRALERADRLVVLQPLAIEELPAPLRHKARVIYQSAAAPDGPVRPDADAFEVCVLAHLRPVKDPFRAAQAARLLPPPSRIRVLHLGAALSAQMEEQARAEQAANPRYRWLDELPHRRALQVLARSRLLVLTSLQEGGANALSEALACRVPVISSRIAGSMGILGANYPGYFPAGDTAALASLLSRAETDAHFYGELTRHCERLAPLVDPRRESESWAALLKELEPSSPRASTPHSACAAGQGSEADRLSY